MCDNEHNNKKPVVNDKDFKRLQAKVIDLEYAFKQLAAKFDKINTDYRRMTDRLTQKALEKLKAEQESK